MHMRLNLPRSIAAAAILSVAAASNAQLRVVQWNITNYGSTPGAWRDPYFQSALFDTYSGRKLVPDCFIVEEVISATAATNLKNLLNSGYQARFGVPGDYEMATFVNGPDTDSMFYYRTSKVDFLGQTTVYTASGSTSDQPRNTMRYDVRIKGYPVASATIAMYAAHMKAQESGTSDDARRELEANRIRVNAGTLNPEWNYLLGGDFNIQNSADLAYQYLVGASYGSGRLYDPINTPGNWNNNAAFKMVQTQEPGTQMDDRHDQLLISGNLWNGSGVDYIGNPAIAYSTTTWNDPNHSYRCWGNDGTTNGVSEPLKIAGNSMVGPTIAQALVNTTTETQGGVSNGHLPVYLDIRVPPDCSVSGDIDFGFMTVGTVAQQSFSVTNSANVSLWSVNGIQNLKYTMSTSNAALGVPTGQKSTTPGSVSNYTATFAPIVPGHYTGTITVSSDSPLNPTRTINWKATVLGFIGGFPVDPFRPTKPGGSDPGTKS